MILQVLSDAIPNI